MTQAENNQQNNHQTATSFFDMVRRLMPDSTQQGNAVDELASIETEEHAASEASQFNNNLENELPWLCIPMRAEIEVSKTREEGGSFAEMKKIVG